MLICLLVLIICALNIHSSTICDPTPGEINKGFVVKQLGNWGQQAREQNSLRILCIGGSNTANVYEHGIGYVNLLNTFVRKDLSTDYYFNTHSYAKNKGKSGASFDLFIGRLFDFEVYNNVTTWPNVVIVDASVNMPAKKPQDTLVLFERLIRSFAFKYTLKNLTTPDFLFYNMPHLRLMYANKPTPNTKKAREQYTKNYPKLHEMFDGDALIVKFAKFYHFPVISFGTATFDAACRHYNNATFSDVPWKYSDDGVHMSSTGVTFGMEKLLTPFFKSVMKPRKEDKLVDVSHWPRMYPKGVALIDLGSYTGYDNEVNIFKLEDIIHKKQSTWSMLKLKHQTHCFASSVKDAKGELRFPVPETCSKGVNCQVHLRFLHSWNTSYIGNTECSLHKHEDVHLSTKLDQILIDGQKDAKSFTIPVRSHFNVNVSEGMHSVSCVNMIENRLSCLIALEINALMIV